MAEKPGLIGKAIRIKGELRGLEDLVIEGKVEGNIALRKHHLFLERSAVIKANAQVNDITIKGELHGNTEAANKVEITATAKLVGDIKTPRLVVLSGARLRGNVDMEVLLPDGLLDDDATAASIPYSTEPESDDEESVVRETEPGSDEAWH